MNEAMWRGIFIGTLIGVIGTCSIFLVLDWATHRDPVGLTAP